MAHSHNHAAGASAPKVIFGAGLTLAFVFGEIIAGYFSHSLALMSDAGHNFADALALVLSAYALWVANRPSNPQKPFGYHRSESWRHSPTRGRSLSSRSSSQLRHSTGFHPVPVLAGPMIWVALAAIVVNFVIVVSLTHRLQARCQRAECLYSYGR
jgi:cobalt-zinc-cadmium efflux system protein